MKYVIIGNGVAGTTAAASIRKRDGNGLITILSDEGYPFYSRIRLIEHIAGDIDDKALIMKDEAWYRERKIDLVLDTAVTDTDPAGKEVITSAGKKIPYDRLLMATGGVSFVPPIPGAGLGGVFTLRTLKDAIAIREHIQRGNRKVLIIGGGVLGLEAGDALRKAGASVTVVESLPRLLPRQMDPEGSAILRTEMEKMGFKFHLGAKTKEMVGTGKVEGTLLEDGRMIACDTVIISAGVRPNGTLAQRLGLMGDKGVTVNDRMETALADVYAAGDVVEHRGTFYGIWPAAEKQGEVAGINMAGGEAVYEGTTISNFLKVAGISIVATGDIDGEGEHESIVLKDPENFVYKKLVIKDGVLVGAILYGDIRDMRKIFKAIEKRRDIRPIRKELESWNLDPLAAT